MLIIDITVASVSILALCLSIISYRSSRKANQLKQRQLVVEKKYDILSNIQGIELRILQVQKRIENLNAPSKQKAEPLNDYLTGVLDLITSLMKNFPNADLNKDIPAWIIEMDETIGILKQENGMLSKIEFKIEELENNEG
jgi:hypothetical protein